MCPWGPSNSVRCTVKEGVTVYLGAQPPSHYFPTDEWFGELLAESPWRSEVNSGTKHIYMKKEEKSVASWRPHPGDSSPGGHTLETTPWGPQPGDHRFGDHTWGPHPGDHTLGATPWSPHPGDHRSGDHTLRTTALGPHPGDHTLGTTGLETSTVSPGSNWERDPGWSLKPWNQQQHLGAPCSCVPVMTLSQDHA